MWREIWAACGGRIAGVTAALFLGFIYLFTGFWDMLFVALLLWAGYYFGKQKDMSAGPVIPWAQISAWFSKRFRSFK